MKYVFATIELAVLVVVGLALGGWAAGMVNQPNDAANAIGFVGGLGGAAALVYVFVKRAEFYING